MDSADIKRMILKESESTGIRKRLIQHYEGGVGHDDIVEMGVAFEQMTQLKGWTYIEAYILGKANPLALLFAKDEDLISKGQAQGLIGLIQHVQQVIQAKNEILKAENAKLVEAKKNEAKTNNRRPGRGTGDEVGREH